MAVIAFLAALLTHPRSGWSDEGGDFGLGLVVGQPTGLSAQLALGGPRLGASLNFAVGIDVLDDDDLYVHADYVVLLLNLLNHSKVDLPLYLGLGGFVIARENARIGARAPIGVQLEFQSTPLHVFVELAMHLTIIEDPDVDLGGALGVRYFF